MSGKSLADLRKLQKHQLNKITKEELIEAILTTEGEEARLIARHDEKLDKIMDELADMRRMIAADQDENKAKIKDLTDTIKKQSEIILHHQLFMEHLDRQKRETNIVLFGIPDERVTLEGATTEEAKIQQVLNAIEATPDVVVRSHQRLGQLTQGSNRSRPLLVRVDSKAIRDKVLERATRLKDMQEPYKKIYIKKDSHPEVRKEWRRLKTAEEEEKNKPSNAGCNIRLDYREPVLYKDGVVIDKWQPHPF